MTWDLDDPTFLTEEAEVPQGLSLRRALYEQIMHVLSIRQRRLFEAEAAFDRSLAALRVARDELVAATKLAEDALPLRLVEVES